MYSKSYLLLKNTLISAAILLALVNLLVIGFHGNFERRLVRLVSSIICFSIFFCFKGYKEKNILLVIILLIIVDVFGIFYEKDFIRIVLPICKIGAYFFIAIEVIKKIKFNNFNKIIYFYLIVLFLLNLIVIIRTIISVSQDINSTIETIIYIFYGGIILFICSLALNYNYTYNSSRSLCYLVMILGLFLSDTSWFIGYYLKVDSAYYFDILFYLIGLFFMAYYGLQLKKEKDILINEDTWK